MDTDYNTGSVIPVNTRSVISFVHTSDMARSGPISEFWKRLSLARRAHTQPKSMRQEDVGRDYGVRQSAVTKWKTGGPTGKAKPKPGKVREIALKEGVAFEWLDSGRGDMRAPRATDPVTQQVVEYMATLPPEAKQKVLEAVITQQVLTIPAVAAQLEQAQRVAERPPRHHNKKAG